MASNTSPGVKGFIRVPLEDRFWSRVEKTDGCWLWRGTVRGPTGRDYGAIHVNGRSRPASQIAWELHHQQPWPLGMDACHHCDTPRCVRPDHIFPGTPSDNYRDSEAKGRMRNASSMKQVCIRGHALSGANLMLLKRDGRPRRHCRECRRAAHRAWEAARAALAASEETQP